MPYKGRVLFDQGPARQVALDRASQMRTGLPGMSWKGRKNATKENFANHQRGETNKWDLFYF